MRIKKSKCQSSIFQDGKSANQVCVPGELLLHGRVSFYLPLYLLFICQHSPWHTADASKSLVNLCQWEISGTSIFLSFGHWEHFMLFIQRFHLLWTEASSVRPSVRRNEVSDFSRFCRNATWWCLERTQVFCSPRSAELRSNACIYSLIQHSFPLTRYAL